jgi:hypothetical protein
MVTHSRKTSQALGFTGTFLPRLDLRIALYRNR